MMENKRFKLINSKLRNSIIVFDKLIEEPIVEIASNNKQLNQYMGKACMMILSSNNEILKIIHKQERNDKND